jgi:hypothetical protein
VHRTRFIVAVILNFAFFILPNLSYAREYNITRGIIDVHSVLSDGLCSADRICGLAKSQGIKVVIFGEALIKNWEYGLWPFRNIFKVRFKEKVGLCLNKQRYLKHLARIKHDFPELIIMPAVEVSPFYYWKGSPLIRDFSLNDYYKKFIIIGLDPDDYRKLPVVGNRQFFCSFRNIIFALIMVLLIIAGAWLFIATRRMFSLLLILSGILFLWNNLPFSASGFTQYQGYQGVKPYQNIINYVNQRGGLIYWAHPEMESLKSELGLVIYTPEHTRDMFFTRNYTGFGVSFIDRLKAVEPGGLWDELLLRYIEGETERPAWIIANLHFKDLKRRIDEVETIFFLKNASQAGVLDALREGRVYVRFNLGDQRVDLEEFSARADNDGSVMIIIKGKNSNVKEDIKIEVVCDGRVVNVLKEERQDWEIYLSDNPLPRNKKHYYRLRISAAGSLILTNPVFVESMAK